MVAFAMRDTRIWFVVLTYYPDKKRIASLVQRLADKRVVIVDNTPDTDRKKYVSADTVFTGENLGYTGGMNRGMEFCFRHGATWVVLVNDDLGMSPSAASHFIAKLKKTEPAIAGPFRGRLDPVRWTSMYPAHSGSFDYLSGSFMAIHKNVIKKVGYFWEPYFIYYEDVELCQRAKRVGFPLIYIPNDATHKDTTTIKRGSVDHEYYLARNHLLFVERNAPAKVKIREFLRLLKTFYEHRGRGNIGAEQGVRDYMLRRFGRVTLGSRRDT